MATTTNVVTNVGAGWFDTDDQSGADFNNPQSVNVNTDPSVPAPRVAVGTRHQGINNSEWVFVQASTTVSQNSLVAIDCNFQANPLTTTLASSNVYTYGLCQIGTYQATNCQPTDYFWALLRASGGATMNISGVAARGAQLYVATAQAGAATTSATGTALKNIFVNTSVSGSTTYVDVVMPSYITVST